MGYAYIFSRFGLPLCVLLVVAVFLLPNHDLRGMRYRAFLMLYLALILSVSGTSAFALKTAGMLWFLLGVLSTLPAPAAAQITATGRSA
jgi:putative polymerase